MKKSLNLLLFIIFNIEYLNNFKKSLIINFIYHHYIENNYNFPKILSNINLILVISYTKRACDTERNN